MRLDGIVISHADLDHFSAIPKLLERFHVAEVIMPPGFFQSAGPQVHAVASALARHAVPAMELHRTSDVQQIACLRTDPNGFCKLTVRHPRRDDPRGDQNAGSIVLELQVGKNVLILPGDLEPPGSADVLQQPPPNPGGCLMAAHHGSLEGDPRALIDWAQPSLVVISGGNRAKRPNVERMYQPANGRLWITARNGAIQVVLPARGKMISSGWLSEPW
jgi:competence protein ComEC